MEKHTAYIYTAIKAAALAFAAMFGATAAAQDVPPMTVRSVSDSTTVIMCDRTTVKVEIVKNSHNGVLLTMPEKEKDFHGLEMASMRADSTELGNGRVQLNYYITFQAFNPSELLTLPGFTYACDGDTVTSDILTFKVLPVDIPEVLGTVENVDSLIINPDVPPVSVPGKFFDFVRPWMLYVLLAIVLLAIAVVLLILYRKNGPRIFMARKPEPPYDVAMRRLNEMRANGMVEKGEPKLFFSEVTDIFRSYLEGRFGIQALEMTSSQIIDQIRRNKQIHLTAGQLEDLLQISDFVKFAAMDPTPSERSLTYKTIREFVESTRPVDEPQKGKTSVKTARKPGNKKTK